MSITCIPASRMNAIKKVQELCPDCIPMPDCGDEINLKPTIEEVQPIVVAPVMSDFSETYVKTAHAKGVKVILDEKEGTIEEWNRILNLGTDGIQTDDPEALIKYIKTRK